MKYFEMKKRTALIGAILSLIPLWQPLIIKTSIALSISGLVLSFSNKVQAEDARFYYMRALEKSNAGDLYGAICEYTKAISINPPSDPNTAMLYVNRGNAKANLGDYKGSLDDFNKAVEINPNYALAYFNRGVTIEILGDINIACADWERASSLGDLQSKDLLQKKCKSNN